MTYAIVCVSTETLNTLQRTATLLFAATTFTATTNTYLYIVIRFNFRSSKMLMPACDSKCSQLLQNLSPTTTTSNIISHQSAVYTLTNKYPSWTVSFKLFNNLNHANLQLTAFTTAEVVQGCNLPWCTVYRHPCYSLKNIHN